MSQSRKYRIIAAFLVTAFSLNIIVGFACSLGLDMGFNSKHHHDEGSTEPVVHIHKDGKRHIHQEKKNSHIHDKSHHHDQDKGHHESDKKKDNCCNDEVKQITQLDKSTPHSFNIIHPNFLIAFFDVFYSADLPTLGISKDIKQFVRSYHPPISNIRIAIQSFQI